MHRQRLVLERDLHLVSVLLLDGLDRRDNAPAERALKIRELHDRHRGALGTFDGCRSNLDLLHRWSFANALLEQRLVEVFRRGAGCEELVRLLDLVIDHWFEAFKWHRTHDLSTIDEKSGCPRSTHRGTGSRIGLNPGAEGPVVERALEFGHVEPNLAGVLF